MASWCFLFSVEMSVVVKLCSSGDSHKYLGQMKDQSSSAGLKLISEQLGGKQLPLRIAA